MNPPSIAVMTKALRAAGWTVSVTKSGGGFRAVAFSRSLDTTSMARGNTKQAALWSIYSSSILGE